MPTIQLHRGVYETTSVKGYFSNQGTLSWWTVRSSPSGVQKREVSVYTHHHPHARAVLEVCDNWPACLYYCSACTAHCVVLGILYKQAVRWCHCVTHHPWMDGWMHMVVYRNVTQYRSMPQYNALIALTAVTHLSWVMLALLTKVCKWINRASSFIWWGMTHHNVSISTTGGLRIQCLAGQKGYEL